MRSTLLFLALFALQHRAVVIVRHDSAKVVDHKKDELIVTLESFSKLHDEEDIRTILTETDSQELSNFSFIF